MKPAGTRRLMDRATSGFGYSSIVLLAAALLLLLGPIAAGGLKAFVFQGTVEFRVMMLELFGRGDPAAVRAEQDAARAARQPVFDRVRDLERDLEADPALRARLGPAFREWKQALRDLLGPLPEDGPAVLIRQRYGQTRWDRAAVKRERVFYAERWDYSDPGQMGRRMLEPRRAVFAGTALEPAFEVLETRLTEMLRPRWTVYGRFLVDSSRDAHFFGGIWPELFGTLILTVGAMLLAAPTGVLAAIYLVEYAVEGRIVTLLRTCISTLAGVPSIVFGLFGLAFFINTLKVSPSKSVLAGALTLALLVLPTIIRAAEEALRAVPGTYKEAAFSLGASRWHTIATVMLPSALPGILTGLIISLGRAAGETAPIIFTAAVSLGAPPAWRALAREPTPALPWNIYNLCTEHAAVDEIRHVQYGMVLTLILFVLALNGAALVLRARLARHLKG